MIDWLIDWLIDLMIDYWLTDKQMIGRYIDDGLIDDR